MSNDAPEAPVLRVVAGGEPTPAEITALVVAFAGRATVAAGDERTSRWNDRHPLLRRPLRPGPDAWRHSLR
jgi:hypothetical protein